VGPTIAIEVISMDSFELTSMDRTKAWPKNLTILQVKRLLPEVLVNIRLSSKLLLASLYSLEGCCNIQFF
jgi:hypothetical protein